MSAIQRLSKSLSKVQISPRSAFGAYSVSRQFSSSSSSRSEQATSSSSTSTTSQNTHFKITLLRSAISLGERKKATLKTLGIHRRMQTVYHPHSPECAGKILAVKELLKVENVPASAVRTKTEQRRERRSSRGFRVLGGLKDRDLELVGNTKERFRAAPKGTRR